ncbi:MAG: complex I NDUFA9 subunit family protein [Burkholderiales bacterium]|nr:MAG: complex I NDUFA9 subunit family protein [Burkholderiales bacterium]
MKYTRIAVIGGSGFVGRHLVPRLASTGRSALVLARRSERVKHLLMLPQVDVIEADVYDAGALERYLAECDAVVNLVGVLHGRRSRSAQDPYGPEFRRAHVDLPAAIVAACKAVGLRRLLHVSALGVRDDEQGLPSRYLRSKAAGERVIREAGDLDWTVFRPSVIFGPEDGFMNLFAQLQRLFPVMPLARASARLQPVYVGDLVQAVLGALDNSATFGRVYELAGPEVFTLRRLVELAGQWSGHPRPVIELPYTLGQLQAGMLEAMPGPTLMSRDNFDSLGLDNVASGPIAPELGIVPTALAAVAPGYLAPRTRLSELRTRARR